MCGILYVYPACPDITDYAKTINNRGPDGTISNEYAVYHRLAIQNKDSGVHFIKGRYHTLLCNGEIYQTEFPRLETDQSDCDVIIRIYEDHGPKRLMEVLRNSEFAFVIINNDTKNVAYFARDRFGIRPLFRIIYKPEVKSDEAVDEIDARLEAQLSAEYQKLVFYRNGEDPRTEEIKELEGIIESRRFITKYKNALANQKFEIYCSEIKYIRPDLLPYCTIEQVNPYKHGGWYKSDIENILTNDEISNLRKEENNRSGNPNNYTYKDYITVAKLNEALNNAVSDRINMTDVPVGYLLSGGMDSSIICAIASRIMKGKYGNDFKINTFAIGLDKSATDILAAREVAKFIDSNHTEVIMEPEDFLAAINETIYFEETYDITTIRAGIPMNLISKYIKNNTDIKVLITGEGSDELFGSYRYFLNAPSGRSHQQETFRLLEDIHYFDVLRCDRTISNNGLEARVPFLDSRVVDCVTTLFAPRDYTTTNGLLKYPLRRVAEVYNYLPASIYNRPKEALSDGVSTEQMSWFEILKNYFMDIKQTTEKAYYYSTYVDYFGNKYKAIPYYWLPRWSGDESDPSARKLNISEKFQITDKNSWIEFDSFCVTMFPCVHYNIKVYSNGVLVEEFKSLNGDEIRDLYKKYNILVDSHFSKE